ncbi:MAG: S-methyl-5'-thioadenosine phosphorylase [Candidatus Aminicenantes bacterium]|nr:MAG: S-methyl-5'-thioadenosine phosphorylase [Candidatus Aminicenantes bacterium]
MTREKGGKIPQAEIGILGGTGLYEIDGIEDLDESTIDTPFGMPSDSYMIGNLEGRRVAFLTRHGRGHRILPSEINYRANIYGFKMLGVERIISVNSVGSLKEEIKPRDIVFSAQFFDRTRRKNTFFGEGIAVHIGFAHPVCPELSQLLFATGKSLGVSVHPNGTYICIEGPAFSTKAESRIYRSWDCDVIGMTSATEARLCREAEICYATMSLVTDYDVWHEEEESVSVELILENLRHNIHNAKDILRKTLTSLPGDRGGACECSRAIRDCIVTSSDLIPQATKQKLQHIIGKYIP